MAEPDPILVNDWHAVVELEFLATRGSFETVLLGVPIEISGSGAGPGEVRVVRRDTGAPLAARIEYGHVFASSASRTGTSSTSPSASRRIGSS